MKSKSIVKPIIVVFSGGPLDGDVLDGASVDGNERFDTTWIASKTDGGEPGGWFVDVDRLRSRSTNCGDGIYRIQSRAENDQCIRLNFVFESPSPFSFG